MHVHTAWPLTGWGLSSRLGAWSQHTVIRALQTGTIVVTTTATATITSVDTANTILHNVGETTPDTNLDPSRLFVTIELTNATTITGTKSTGVSAVTAGYVLQTCVPGVLQSVTRGLITMAGVATNTATITSVDTAKSHVMNLGFYTTNTTTNTGTARGALTNATTVTATQGAAASTTVLSYQVPQYF